MNKIDGQRISAALAYLGANVRSRSKLAIVPNTLARRVRFRNGQAQSLEVERHGRVFEMRVDRIGLAAGAVATSGFLIRSGVGNPAAEIARLGMDPRAHEGVSGC